jgi:hypothetical protein
MLLIFKWFFGLSISLAAGHFASRKFRDFRNKHIEKVTNNSKEIELIKKDQIQSDLLPTITGIAERFFFTLIIAFDVSGGAVAMIAWLGAKMAVNWNRLSGENPVARGFSMTALQTGMVSLFFALLGGLICR